MVGFHLDLVCPVGRMPVRHARNLGDVQHCLLGPPFDDVVHQVVREDCIVEDYDIEV